MEIVAPDEDLDFHLRELRYDLAGLSREVLELAPFVAAGKAEHLCRAFQGICASIEHDYVEHSASALDLARSPAPERRARQTEPEIDRDSDERWSRAEGMMPEVRSAEDLLDELRLHVEGLSASLSEATAKLEGVEAQRSCPSASQVQVDDLLERVHTSIAEAMHRAFFAMKLATWLARLTRPEA